MNRRDVLIAGGWALTGTALAAAAEQQPSTATQLAHMEHHVKTLTDCLRECESCSDHCSTLVASGKKEHQSTQKNCADCAEFCTAATRIIARSGPMSALIAQACAKACDACATECEKFASDEHMKRCGRSCRDCSQICREVSDRAGTGLR